jgi:hypothetical protein
MSHLESNCEERKEIRARADSIANAIFLIAGGALWSSITVMLSNKGAGLITQGIANHATLAWKWLLASIIIFLFLKVLLILQAFLLQFRTEFVNKHLSLLNGLAWPQA